MASNLDKAGEERDHMFVNAASHFGPLGYFLELVNVREASLPLPTHHITSYVLLQHSVNVMMEISLQ